MPGDADPGYGHKLLNRTVGAHPATAAVPRLGLAALDPVAKGGTVVQPEVVRQFDLPPTGTSGCRRTCAGLIS
ncbi:hypothetical protein [Nonomuraea sp. NPDC002799]